MSKENAVTAKTDSSQGSNSTLHTDHVDRGQAVQTSALGLMLTTELTPASPEASSTRKRGSLQRNKLTFHIPKV